MTQQLTPKYFRVSPKFWTDPQVEAWSDDAKLLALYLLTCPQRTTEGLFSFRKAYAQADLGWDTERFDKGFTELLEAGFIKFDPDARVLLIMNALRYQAPENENQAKHAVKNLLSLPETPLTCTFRNLVETHSEHLAKQLPKGFGKGMAKEPEPSSSSSTHSQALPVGADAILRDVLKSGTKYPDRFKGHLGREVKGLLTEGFSREQVTAAAKRCVVKGLSPGTLPSLVVQVSGNGTRAHEPEIPEL